VQILISGSSRKYPYLPHRRDFSKHLPTPLEILLKLHTFLKFVILIESLIPQEIPIPSVRGGGGGGKKDFFLKLHLII